MSAFDLFRSSVPKLVCTYPIPLTSKSNLWCGTDTQPRPALRDQPQIGIGQAARRSP